MAIKAIDDTSLHGIANGIRAAGDLGSYQSEIVRYTPSEMATAVSHLAENYNDTLNVIEQDNDIFDDISEAIQSKTGQVSPYDKDEMADAIDGIDTYVIPIDPNSEAPVLVTGIDARGFYYSRNPNDKTNVLFGVDSNNKLYATQGGAE